MKQSKGYVHKIGGAMSHPTEVYDHVVPMAYKGKDFTRAPKSYLRTKPNNLGDRLGIDKETGLQDGF